MKSSAYKTLPAKRLPKSDREQAVLFGLIELYIKTGKPIGSQTLQENGFESLSSATIRNYFSKMEEDGYLKQPHTSGGRIPTEKAFRLFAKASNGSSPLTSEEEEAVDALFRNEKKEIATLLSQAAFALSEMTHTTVFMSSPRFDQDFVQDVRLLLLAPAKILSVVITDFGLIHTETIYLEKAVDELFLRSAEEYFLWRMNKGEKPLFRKDYEGKLAQKIYNEVMVRHVVGYANFSHEDIIREGLSKLLSYPEFSDASALASSLSLLENEEGMQALLRKSTEKGQLTTWIGSELVPFLPQESECAVVAIPYKINQTNAGAIALLGPMRLSYKKLYSILRSFSEKLSQTLTGSVYKYKITFRQPTELSEKKIAKDSSIQIEDKSRKE